MFVHGEEVLVPAHLNFGKFILDRLRRANPDETCLVNCTRGERLSYGEFTQHLVSVAAGLAALGAGRGHTVALGGEPRVTFLPTTLAGVLTGATVTTIELDCGRAVLAHKLNLTRPTYMICSRFFWETYSNVLKGLDFIKTFICFDDIDDIELSIATMASRHVDVTTFEPAAVRAETDVARVVYTSGTTGMSKGVQLTHLNCIARTNITWYHDFESLQTCFVVDERYGTYIFFLMCHFLSAGKRVIYSESGMDLKTLQDYQVDTTPTIPVGVAAVVNAERTDENDLPSMKIMYSAAAFLQPSIKKAFKQRYPHIKLLQVYGATEVDVITVQKPSNTDATAIVGVAVPGVTLKVVDVKTRATLGPNQRGEICVRSPCLMKGYLGTTAEYLDEQGFYLTGDLGYYDDHKQFYLVDRLKDIITYYAYKVAPADVEAVLLRHWAVRECAVVGKPAGAAGELPVAFVALRPGAHATQADLVHYVDKEVSPYMRLRGGVRFVTELPRSPRHKVLRRQLREMLELEESSDNSLKTRASDIRVTRVTVAMCS